MIPEKKIIGFRIFTQENTVYHYIFPDKTPLSIISDWYANLSSLLIQKDFHLHYEAIKKIGKGHFASVRHIILIIFIYTMKLLDFPC